MRSRPQVKVRHTADITPGDLMHVDFSLDFSDETPVDELTVTFSGHQFAATGAGKSRVVDNYESFKMARRFEPKTFAPGRYDYNTVFQVPSNAPPSHEGYDANVRYQLLVYVSIPWWPDRRATYVVPIRFEPTAPYAPTPFVFTNGGRQSDSPVIELSLDTTDVAVGETLRGQVAISDLGGRTCRGVNLTLIQVENVRTPHRVSRIANRWARRIFHGQPADGDTIPFSIRVPDEAHPSFMGALYGTAFQLEIRADISLGSDVVLLVPLVVRSALSEPREKPATLVQPVGNGRLERVFTVVAGRLQLMHEPGQRTLHGTAGSVNVTISLAHRNDGWYRVATLKFAPLGVGFAVEKKGVGNLFGIRDRDVERLPGYVVTARDTAQVDSICETIGRFAGNYEELHFQDDGAYLATKGDAATVEALTNFALKALDFANTLSERFAEIPAPLGMEPFVPAWQAYAERIGGKLSRSCMRIDGGRIGFDAFTIATHFAVHGVPNETVLELSLDPKLTDFSLDSPNLSAHARKLAAALIEEHHARISPDMIEIALPAGLPDPNAYAVLVDRMAQTAAALRGGAAPTPYR